MPGAVGSTLHKVDPVINSALSTRREFQAVVFKVGFPDHQHQPITQNFFKKDSLPHPDLGNQRLSRGGVSHPGFNQPPR